MGTPAAIESDRRSIAVRTDALWLEINRMTDSQSQFDPERLQARWVLGGLNAEELAHEAVLALQHGFSGIALQQLAGLVRPTKRDLENLPERAFGEMGLQPINKDQAVTHLISRGEPSTSGTISELLDAFADFSDRWKQHIASWGGKPAGSYNDMAEFVYFVVEDLYEKGKIGETRRVFRLLGKFIVNGEQETRDLIGIGFFEGLQCVASWRPYGNKVFEQFLGSLSLQVWREIQRMWAGKSSLMDVIRAERQRH